jgi:hypothetical protein
MLASGRGLQSDSTARAAGALREKPMGATDLINVEIDRLAARQKRLREGLVAHQENIELQRQAMESVGDEIKTIDMTLKKLRADREKLNGHARHK